MKNQEFISRERIAQIAPSVMSQTTSDTLSSKYVHIPTSQVIDDMEKLGWNVVNAKQAKVRSTGRSLTTRHIVEFGNDNVKINGNDGDTVFPRIIMMNSHDGRSSFQFRVGLFRLVCSNGLIIADEEFAKMNIRHMGYSFEDLRMTINKVVEKLPSKVDMMNDMKNIELTKTQKEEFASKALSLRFDLKKNEFDMDEVLAPLRQADEGNDLWKVFNVIQEKVTQGAALQYGIMSPKKVKTRKVQPIKNFQRDLELNQDIFNLAKEYINA